MSSRPRGVTLMEALFSLFVCSLVMFALADTLSSAGSVSRNRQEMDKAIEVSHVLSLMSADASAELTFTTPEAGATASSLVLRRVNPRLSFDDRIDASGGGDETNPYENPECIDVVYQVEDDMLTRTTTIPGGETSKERLIPCTALETSRRGGVAGTLLDIALTIPGERVEKKYRVRVCLR